MPEVYVQIEWPDKQLDKVYSPSSVITGYFKAGDSLSVTEFQTKVEEALNKASKRVLERFGFECTSAMGELERLKKITSGIEDKNGAVKIIRLE